MKHPNARLHSLKDKLKVEVSSTQPILEETVYSAFYQMRTSVYKCVRNLFPIHLGISKNMIHYNLYEVVNGLHQPPAMCSAAKRTDPVTVDSILSHIER